MKQVKVFLEHLTTHTWTLADQQKAIELQSQAIADLEKQEPDPDALHDAYIMGVQDGKKMRETSKESWEWNPNKEKNMK